MLRQIVIIGIIGYYMPANVNAQVTFDGPKEAKTGQMTTITLVKVVGEGLSTQLFKDGKPSTDGLFLKTLDDKPVFFIVPQESAVYTLVTAVQVDKKAVISFHTLTVGSPKPPVPPTPTDDLQNKLAAALQQSPGFAAADFDKLIEVYVEVNKATYADTSTMNTVLAETMKQFLGPDKFRPLRNEVQSYLRNAVGNDITKAKPAFDKLIETLKRIK